MAVGAAGDGPAPAAQRAGARPWRRRWGACPPPEPRRPGLGNASLPTPHRRYIPLLTPKNVKYELHLFAEQRDATADKVGPIILQAATQIDPACVVTAAHNKASGTGSAFAGAGACRGLCLLALAPWPRGVGCPTVAWRTDTPAHEKLPPFSGHRWRKRIGTWATWAV